MASPGEPFSIITIHFDVNEHRLPLSDFTDLSLAIEDLVDKTSRKLFGDKVKVEVFILPAESGGFIGRVAISAILIGTIPVAFALVESNVGVAFIRGLTGNEPAFYFAKLGEGIRHSIINDDPDTEDGKQVQKEKSAQPISEMIRDSSVSFLTANAEKTKAAKTDPINSPEIFQARNNFYTVVYRNSAINGVGFDSSNQFPIDRKTMPELIVFIPPPEEREDAGNLVFEIRIIQVTSPNWDRSDTRRTWKAKIDDKRSVTFSISDENFWKMVNEKAFPTMIRDTLKVQWAFRMVSGRRRDANVIRVLEVNGKNISKVLSDEELAKIFGDTEIEKENETDLFSWRNGKEN